MSSSLLPTEDRRHDRPRPGRVVRLVNGPSRTSAVRPHQIDPSHDAANHGTSGQKVESAPPALHDAPDSAWQRFMSWLLAPAPHEAAAPPNRLDAVREDFLLAIADLPGQAAHALRYRVVHAGSLRDLWHLRAEVFSLVGLEHAQLEAERRLVRLNRHFPMRASRSQFGSLGAQ